jgi:pSer/pThr/pTyr-binding forkhead associated (FHA) protein
MTAKPSSKSSIAVPTLNVTYGHAAKKQFQLDQASTVLGRARGCDVELESVDISSVHCVITRGAEGLVIRDLNSRSGTKVNGERIRNEVALRDTDLLQVGPFSFEVAAPARATPDADLEGQLAAIRQQMAKLETSRERIAEMAISLRRRLAAERSAHRAGPEGQASAEINEQMRHLADRQADLEQREIQLQKTERALRAQSEEAVKQQGSLRSQQESLRTQVEAHEQELAKFQADQRTFDRERDEAIQEVTALQDHLEKRQEELSHQHARAEEELRAAYQQLEKACAEGRDAAASPGKADDAEAQRRKRELSSFAHYLRQYRSRLQERSTAIEAGEKELNQAWGGLLEAQDHLLDEQRRLEAVREEMERAPSPTPAESEMGQISALLDGLARLYAESRQLQDAELRALRQLCDRISANPEVTPAPGRFPSPLLGGNVPPVAPAQPRRGKLTERVNIAALLDRIGQAKS